MYRRMRMKNDDVVRNSPLTLHVYLAIFVIAITSILVFKFYDPSLTHASSVEKVRNIAMEGATELGNKK